MKIITIILSIDLCFALITAILLLISCEASNEQDVSLVENENSIINI